MSKTYLIVLIAIIFGLAGFLPLGEPAIAAYATMNNKERLLEIIERQAKAWENGDIESLGADFAEDAVFVVGKKVFNGKQQIQAAARDYFNQFTDTKINIKRTIIEDERGAVEWDWQDKSRKSGQMSYAEDAIIFELENGEIVYWREYIEKQ